MQAQNGNISKKTSQPPFIAQERCKTAKKEYQMRIDDSA